jgi:predicted metal-dependent enzyme (double-stranded beta helix superfamily)
MAREDEATMRPLDRFIRELEAIVRPDAPVVEITTRIESVLKRALDAPRLLDESQRRDADDGYQQHVLHVAADGRFSLVSLVWRPEQRTPIHDHRGWCVVGVYEGEECETRYRLVSRGGQERLEPVATRIHRRGETTRYVPPDDIHQVENRSAATAISIHAYGVDVGNAGSSINRRFPPPSGCRLPRTEGQGA